MKVINFPDSRAVNVEGVSSISVRPSAVKMVARINAGSRIYFTDGTHVDIKLDFDKAKEYVK